MLHFETYVVIILLIGVILRIVAFLMPSGSHRTPGGAGPGRYPGRKIPVDR